MIDLSVIIPTRNRSQLLQKALESLAQQTFPIERFETIVIDNGSSDDTKAITKPFNNRLNLKYHYDDRPGLHVGRHNGMKLSRSNILVFADDDIEATATWLEGIYESFQDKKIVLVGGKNLPKYEIQPPFWILEKWYQMCEFGHCVPELSILDFGNEIKEIPANYVFGCNFAIRKEILQDTNGFHPDGMPFEMIQYRGDGETYVSQYISNNKLKTIYNPKASIIHFIPDCRLTLDYFKKRAFCQGIEMSYMDLRYSSFISYSKHGKKIKRLFQRISGKETCDNIKSLLHQEMITDIEKQIEQSRQIGYNFHQHLYHSDKNVRLWVHKDNYLS